MASRSGSAFSPSAATRPLTVTSPSRISSSALRREAIPARARIFCRRSSLTAPHLPGPPLPTPPFPPHRERREKNRRVRMLFPFSRCGGQGGGGRRGQGMRGAGGLPPHRERREKNKKKAV